LAFRFTPEGLFRQGVSTCSRHEVAGPSPFTYSPVILRSTSRAWPALLVHGFAGRWISQPRDSPIAVSFTEGFTNVFFSQQFNIGKSAELSE
jgi:hypothetical protein